MGGSGKKVVFSGVVGPSVKKLRNGSTMFIVTSDRGSETRVPLFERKFCIETVFEPPKPVTPLSVKFGKGVDGADGADVVLDEKVVSALMSTSIGDHDLMITFTADNNGYYTAERGEIIVKVGDIDDVAAFVVLYKHYLDGRKIMRVTFDMFRMHAISSDCIPSCESIWVTRCKCVSEVAISPSLKTFTVIDCPNLLDPAFPENHSLWNISFDTNIHRLKIPKGFTRFEGSREFFHLPNMIKYRVG